MDLITIDKNRLEAFVASEPHAQFLQSWEWGDFNLGQVWRRGLIDDGRLVAAVSLLKKVLPLGLTYFYSPRGPIIDAALAPERRPAVMEKLSADIRSLAKKEGAMFWRLEPAAISAANNLRPTIEIQPRQTLLIDLSQSAAELLSAMHPKTRYNIRLAEKKGVEITHGRATDQDKAAWWRLISATGRRDAFKLHGRKYYERLLALSFIELWQAVYQGEVLAMAIVAKYGDTATYVHGASADSQRQLMAPYLLHWQVINLAKDQGLKYYDFYGIDEVKWPGVSRFKEGFGGQKLAYAGTFDLVFKPVYYRVYQILRKIRRAV